MGCSGGAMALGLLPGPVRPTNWELLRLQQVRGEVYLDNFSLNYHLSLLSPSL